ncbi:MAG: LCP family protein, partial [Acidimicrobiia bacterium]
MTETLWRHPLRPMNAAKRRRAVSAAALIALLGAALAACSGDSEERSRSIVIGRPVTTVATTTSSSSSPTAPTTSSSATAPPPPPPSTAAPAAVPFYGPDGAAYGPAIAFTSTVPVPGHLVFVLVVGSDARPGHDPLRANADSIHLMAVDPRTGRGTIIGFPRDSWVTVPGKGVRKLNSALALGGPNLMAETVRQVTGLPVDYHVVTGFAGFKAMVEELGGMNVEVGRRMRDLPSG